MIRRYLVRLLVTAAVALLVVMTSYLDNAQADTSGTLYITTVPATADVRFGVDGFSLTTGHDGAVSVNLANLNGVAGRVHLVNGSLSDGSRATVSKIVSAQHASRQSHLNVGLNIASPVSLSISQGGTDVPATSISALRLHSIAGQIVTVDPQKTSRLTLLSRQTRLVHGVLAPIPVTWSVDRVVSGPGVSLTTKNARFDPYVHRQWPLSLEPVHGVVEIRTVPSTPGVLFTLDGATITTGADGTASAPVTDLNNVKDRLKLATSQAGGGLNVSALRVNKLPPRRPGERRLVAALDVRRPVQLRFFDLANHPVPVSRVHDLRMSYGSNDVRLVGDELSAPVLLLDRVATRIGSDWESRQVRYTLSSVRVDGSEAVFDGRQNFRPEDASMWSISLAVFQLSVTTRDAVFGSEVGSRLVVTRPDGSRFAGHIGKGGAAVFPSLVRGLYQLRIDSAVAGGKTSVLVSRNDAVNLRVVTLTDAAIIIAVAVIMVPLIIFGGRAMARRRRSQDPSETP
jgi:hypothetical protein